MSAQKTIIDLINGNITAAKESAKRFNYSKLLEAANELGIERRAAALHAGYLKGRCTWEQFCEGVAPTMPDTTARGLAYFLRERRDRGLAQEAKDEAANCDPAAVYGIAASLDAFAHGDKFRDNISEAYNGADQFMREIMKVGEAFERWANAHVDFDQLADVWPYMLQEKFAEALEAASPGAILALDKLTADDFAKIAAQLNVTIKN